MSPYQIAIRSLEDYLKTSPWRERFEEHFEYYLSRLREALNISVGEFNKKIELQPYAGYVYGIVFESFFDNVIEEYLKRRGWKLSKEARIILEQLKNNPFSIYEVLEVTPSESLIVQDFLSDTGEEITVFEKKGSTSLKPFQFIVARVIKDNNKNSFTGCILRIDQNMAEEIKRDVQKTGLLKEYTEKMLVSAFKYMLTPKRTLTYEGDDISPAEITFAVKDRKKVINKLNRHEDLYIAVEESENPFWNWAVDKNNIKRNEEDAYTFETFLDNGFLVLGNIELLEGNKLYCSAMSEPRTKNLIQLLQDYLGDLIEMPIIKQVDIKKNSKQKTKKPEKKTVDEDEISMMKECFDDYYASLLDEKIPGLNNQTPRECAKNDPKRVIRWLKMLDENEATKKINYDTGWIWKELKVKK